MVPTSFSMVYNSFLSKTTDDMYLELTEQDTLGLLKELLLSAIPQFEFPRVSLEYEFIEQSWCKKCSKYEECRRAAEADQGWIFLYPLTDEEINILATYMVVEWVGQQLASVENTRMKYSGSDFKFTSQANHMQKLLQIKKDYERMGFHLQRLYKRRIKDVNGIYHTTIPTIMEELDTEFEPFDRHSSHCGCRFYQAIIWNDFSDIDKDDDCPC